MAHDPMPGAVDPNPVALLPAPGSAGPKAVLLLPELAAIPQRTASLDALFDGFHALKRGLRALTAIPEIETSLVRLHVAEGRATPGASAAALGIEPRRLRRFFARHVGLSPQGRAAVLRFQRAVILGRDGLATTGSAVEAGCADRSHMTRAFRRHGGFTPGRMPEVSLEGPPPRWGARRTARRTYGQADHGTRAVQPRSLLALRCTWIAPMVPSARQSSVQSCIDPSGSRTA